MEVRDMEQVRVENARLRTMLENAEAIILQQLGEKWLPDRVAVVHLSKESAERTLDAADRLAEHCRRSLSTETKRLVASYVRLRGGMKSDAEAYIAWEAMAKTMRSAEECGAEWSRVVTAPPQGCRTREGDQ